MLVALVHRDRSVGPSVAVCACACVGGVRGQSRRGRNGRRVLRAPRSPEMELAMRVVAACVVACEMGMESKAAIGSDRSVHRTSLALIEMHCGTCLGVLASSRHDEKERSRLEARPPRRRSARKKQPACSLLSSRRRRFLRYSRYRRRACPFSRTLFTCETLYIQEFLFFLGSSHNKEPIPHLILSIWSSKAHEIDRPPGATRPESPSL